MPWLPCVDAHHHLWDASEGVGGPHVAAADARPAGSVDPAKAWPAIPRYLLPDFLADIDGSGHNVVATVYMECGSMFLADGPLAMRSVGEVAFVSGVAAAAASGTYTSTRVAAGITSTADPTLGGAGIEPVLRAQVKKVS
eukprot:COSAG01_NODE_5558_length_4185_cov_3.756241_4_plen_140_part_00